MSKVSEFVDRFFKPVIPLPRGIYHYQTPADAPTPYRLHLRIHENGEGTLIFNASTILQLNNTATEYAYHLVKQTPLEQIAKEINRRYRVPKNQALQDYQEFAQKIQTFTEMQDLDPVINLNFDRSEPYSSNLSAPYRLDCAITYQLGPGESLKTAPVERVKRELSTQEWKTILEKAWQAGIPHIIFTGGEPTIRTDLVDLIRHAESLEQVTGLLTDGHKLGEPQYLQLLMQSGLDHIMVLLEPGDNVIMENIRQVVAEDIFLVVHLTLSAQNSQQAESAIHQLSEIGVKAISLSANDSQLGEALQSLRSLAASKGMRIVWDLPVPYSHFNPIAFETEDMVKGAGRAWLYVEPDGDVLAEQGNPLVLGNFLNTPWDVIWKK